MFKILICAFWGYLITCFGWGAENEDIEYDTVSAIGWDAVFQDDDGIQKRPVVFWEITYCDEVLISAIGMTYVANKPPFLESAPEHPQFVGYERVTVVSTNPRLEYYDPFDAFND